MPCSKRRAMSPATKRHSVRLRALGSDSIYRSDAGGGGSLSDMRWSTSSRSWILALLLVASAENARAEKPPRSTEAATHSEQGEPSRVVDEKAVATFKEGIAAFDRRDFEAARVAFLQTFALKPAAPVVRRNLGLAEIYSGHYLDGARRLARVFHTTDDGSSEDRARMLESLKKAEAHLERVSLEVDQEGAEIWVDGVDLGTSPLPFVWYVAPGSYDVRVQKSGFVSYEVSRVASPGATHHLRIVLRPVVVEAPAPARQPVPVAEPRAETGPNGWVLLAGGTLTAGAVITGAVFSIAAAENADKVDLLGEQLNGLECNEVEGVPECDDLIAASKAHDRQQRFALASFVVAGVAGIGTLLYGILAGGDDAAEPAAHAGQHGRAWAASFDGKHAYASWRTSF